MTVETKLRIAAQFDNAIAALRALKREAKATTTEIDSGSGSGSKGQPFKPVVEGAQKAGQAIGQVRSLALGLFGLSAGGAAVRELAQMADNYSAISSRLRLATGSQEGYNEAMRKATSLARQYQQPLNETVSLYSRLLGSLKDTKDGTAQAGVATEALLASLRITGASAAESGSAILQFSQALGAGALRGEEFNAVAESAPALLDALARGLGKPRGELKQLAEQGQLTAQIVSTALARELPRLQMMAAQIPQTIGGAMGQVTDRFAEYVGKAAESSGATRVLVSALQGLAQNLTPIANAVATIAAALTAAAIGRAAATFGAWAIAAGGAALQTGGLAAATTGLAAAFRAALGVVGGPVGLIVAIGSLGLAYRELSAAQREQRLSTLDGARAERDAVAKQLADMERKAAEADAKAASGEGGVNIPRPARDKRIAELRANLQAIDERIAAMQDTQRQSQRSIDAAQEANPIPALPDANKGGTRVSQLRQAYDAELELLADNLKRQARLNDQQYQDNLKDLQSYLAERQRIEVAEAEVDIKRLGERLAAARVALEKNLAARSAVKAGDSTGELDDAVFKDRQEILRLETEIAKKKRDQADAAAAVAAESAKGRVELEKTLASVQLQTKQIGGTETAEDIAARVKASLQPVMDEVRRLGGDSSAVLKLIDVTTVREQFQAVEQEFQRMQDRLRDQEAAVETDLSLGLVNQSEAETRILKVRRDSVDALAAQSAKLTDIAEKSGSPELIDKAKKAADSVKRLTDMRTEMDRVLSQQVSSGFATLLNDLQTRAKSTGQAFRDFFAGIANSALALINKRLGDQLANALFPKEGSGDGFLGYVNKLFTQLASSAGKLFSDLGNWVSQLFSSLSGSGGGGGGGNFLSTAATWVTSLFHTGGVVGQSSGMSRAVSPAMWIGARAYHSGGIVGLAPRERPIIALDGEEVLREDNPRHIKNFGRTSSVGSVDIKVAVQVTSGDQAQAKASGDAMAQDLAQMVDARISTWAAREQRPGGVLQSGGRR